MENRSSVESSIIHSRLAFHRPRLCCAWVFLVLVIPSLPLFSQEHRSFEKEGRFIAPDQGLSLGTVHQKNSSYDGPQPFDVLKYDLAVSLPMVTNALEGRQTITMRLKYAVDSLVLHGVGLQFDTVRVDGVQKNTSQNVQAETFTIHLNGMRNAGDTLRVQIAYLHVQGYPRPSSRQGYYFFLDTIGNPANLGYTFSEPSDARFWMPCYDEPWEKATAELRITVPDGYVAASNGRLLGATANGDGTVTWHWKEENQIATYLMCMTVSRFAISSLPHVTSANDTIPLQYFTWQPDSVSAAGFLFTINQMVDFYESMFGTYPFAKYGMTSIVPFGYLGMEHQTITTLNRYFQTDVRTGAHELAHQWWGDLVTCGTWADIWLNESFATYSEALWREHEGGFPALKSYMVDTLEEFQFASWQGAVYNPVGQGFNLFDRVVYTKGGWVLHTLRGILGDSTFFRALRAYREKYSGRSAITAELVAVVDSVTGTDMSWFFNQWIFGQGWPEYGYRYQWANDTVEVEIGQFQTPSWPTYKMPIRLRINYADSTDTTVVVLDSLRLQTFRIPLSRPLQHVEFDPDNWILKKMFPWPVYVRETEQPLAIGLRQNYPNPFNPTTTIVFTLPSQSTNIAEGRGRVGSYVTLKVYDVLGRDVATLVNQRLGPGTYTAIFDGAGLASGMYVYRLEANGHVLSHKMLLLK